jgi:hypothetical protein
MVKSFDRLSLSHHFFTLSKEFYNHQQGYLQHENFGDGDGFEPGQ